MADTQTGRSDEVQSRSSRDHELVFCVLSPLSGNRFGQHDAGHRNCVWDLLCLFSTLLAPGHRACRNGRHSLLLVNPRNSESRKLSSVRKGEAGRPSWQCVKVPLPDTWPDRHWNMIRGCVAISERTAGNQVAGHHGFPRDGARAAHRDSRAGSGAGGATTDGRQDRLEGIEQAADLNHV